MKALDRSRQIAAERLAAPPTHGKPDFARLHGAQVVERFSSELRIKGAHVIEIEALSGLAYALEPILRELGVGFDELAVSSDTAFDAVGFGSRSIEAQSAKASLTHAWAGVAETGTLVLASGPENPTTLVFLPDVHIVAVQRARLYAAYEDALSALVSEQGTMPRAVNLVSGPSRTGDIGGRIVLGAHGPRHLIVIVYGAEKCP